MATEYTAAAVQLVNAGSNVQFTDNPIRCTKGYVQHREGSGLFTLRGITSNCFARYKVFFDGNIAVPADATPDEISLSIAIDGEPLAASMGAFTPAIAGRYGNVSMVAFIDVPKCCCTSIAIENTSAIPIDVRNANLVIDRVA